MAAARLGNALRDLSRTGATETATAQAELLRGVSPRIHRAARPLLMTPPMVDELEPGTILRQKYRIERVLGRGGMGKVLEAWHVDLERRVAIKVLHSELRTNAALVERFLREGRAASKIEGDHVARILDVDRLEDGTPFLVMEYLEGSDLSSVRRHQQPLPIHEAVEYALQACSAIAQAHARGIIHRDVKPANLFLSKQRDGSLKVKVLDFGISKMAGGLSGSEPSMTSTSLVMGSAEYMSPEQMLSTRDVDARTDVWALGIVLYELLTAKVPFPGESLTQVCALVMMATPAPPRSLRPDIPEALERVILHCLEKDRERRFATVAALSTALRATLSSTHVGLGPITAPVPDLEANHQHPGAEAPGATTSVLPTTPVPYHRVANVDASIVPNPLAPSASPLEAMPQHEHPTSLSAPSLEPHISQSARFHTGASQAGGSYTNAALSSDPIPTPPKRSKATALFGGVLLLSLVGLAAGTTALMRGAKPSSSAVAPSSATTIALSSANAAASASPDPRKPTPIISPSDSAEPRPTIASASAIGNASAAPTVGSGKPAAAAKAKRESTPEPPTKPTANAKPVRPSGID